MGRPNWQVAWFKRSPGIPILSRVKVAQDIAPVPPPQVDYSAFSSDRYGGLGATSTVVYFPGDAASVAGEFVPLEVTANERAAPRSRLGRGIRVEAPVPQTVGNRRRAQVFRASAPIASVVPGIGGAAVIPEGAGAGGSELKIESPSLAAAPAPIIDPNTPYRDFKGGTNQVGSNP